MAACCSGLASFVTPFYITTVSSCERDPNAHLNSAALLRYHVFCLIHLTRYQPLSHYTEKSATCPENLRARRRTTSTICDKFKTSRV